MQAGASRCKQVQHTKRTHVLRRIFFLFGHLTLCASHVWCLGTRGCSTIASSVQGRYFLRPVRWFRDLLWLRLRPARRAATRHRRPGEVRWGFRLRPCDAAPDATAADGAGGVCHRRDDELHLGFRLRRVGVAPRPPTSSVWYMSGWYIDSSSSSPFVCWFKISRYCSKSAASISAVASISATICVRCIPSCWKQLILCTFFKRRVPQKSIYGFYHFCHAGMTESV